MTNAFVEKAAGDSRIEQWFASRNWEPFGFQREVWDAYARGESGLIHAATGTGKTYAAWLGPVIEALRERASVATVAPTVAEGVKKVRSARSKRASSEPLRVLWITPLRAHLGTVGDTGKSAGVGCDAVGDER